jgi:hypothetical protein
LILALQGEELCMTATLLDVAQGKSIDTLSVPMTTGRHPEPAVTTVQFAPVASAYRILYLATDLEGIKQCYAASRASLEVEKAGASAQDFRHAPLRHRDTIT